MGMHLGLAVGLFFRLRVLGGHARLLLILSGPHGGPPRSPGGEVPEGLMGMHFGLGVGFFLRLRSLGCHGVLLLFR